MLNHNLWTCWCVLCADDLDSFQKIIDCIHSNVFSDMKRTWQASSRVFFEILEKFFRTLVVFSSATLTVHLRHSQRQHKSNDIMAQAVSSQNASAPKGEWITGSGPDGHFSDALRLNLKNIALNQFKCFDALKREYPNLLANKDYDDKEGNSEAFWESIVVDYEVSECPFHFFIASDSDQFVQI